MSALKPHKGDRPHTAESRQKGVVTIPQDVRWFWTPEWQSAEREAADQLARGEGEFFNDGAEFLKDLADRAGAMKADDLR